MDSVNILLIGTRAGVLTTHRDHKPTEVLMQEFFLNNLKFFKRVLNLFFIIYWLHGIQDPSSPTRDHTHAPCIGNTKS